MKQERDNKFTYDEISAEIENRINKMESEDYVFPERIKAVDYVCCFLLILLCLTIVICMVIYCAML